MRYSSYQDDNERSLVLACERGEVEEARWLLSQGADVNLVDALGRSPLLMSCLADQPNVTELLLYHGARCHVNVLSRDGADFFHLHANASSPYTSRAICSP